MPNILPIELLLRIDEIHRNEQIDRTRARAVHRATRTHRRGRMAWRAWILGLPAATRQTGFRLHHRLARADLPGAPAPVSSPRTGTGKGAVPARRPPTILQSTTTPAPRPVP
jgi:hypothetical protein